MFKAFKLKVGIGDYVGEYCVDYPVMVLDKKPSVGDIIDYINNDVTVTDIDSLENTRDYLSFEDNREFFSVSFKFDDGLRHSVVATVI